METRFIDGGEYVDRQTYLAVRNINSQLRDRIAELENAIRKHRDTVATLLAVFEGDDRAETCEEDNQLWAVLGDNNESV